MNPLDWSLIAWPLPVILLVSALLALAWLAAWRNAPRHGLATTAFARIDPLAVLARTRFPRNSGVFVGGTNDRVHTSQQRIIYLAARHAGMNVTFMDLPGGHDWRIWRGGLEHSVAWLASQLGITERAR